MTNGVAVPAKSREGSRLCRQLVLGAFVGLSSFGLVSCGGGGDDAAGVGGGQQPGGGQPGVGSTQFAYVANNISGNVSTFRSDPNGNLVLLGAPVPAGSSPHSINVDPRGRFVYVANHESSFLSAYTIDQSTGALTPVAGAVPGQVPVANEPHASVFDRTGQRLYVITGTGASSVTAYTVNPNGTLTLINGPFPIGTHAHNLTVDPSNRFVYTASDVSNEIHVFAINPATGGLVQVGGAVAGQSGPLAVAVDPDTKFAYVPNAGGVVQAFAIDAASGALTPLSPATSPAGGNAHSVAIDPTGNFLYVANINDNTITAYRINRSTGALTELGPTATGSQPHYLAVKELFLYVVNFAADNIQRFTIDPATGALSSPATFSDPAADGPISIGITSL